MATKTERAVKDGLALLAIAFRSEIDAPQLKVYLRALDDIGADVIAPAADRLLRQAGRRFLPSPAEWIEVCATVIDERRDAMAKRVAEMKAKCELQKEGSCISGLIEVDGKMQRCDCHLRGLEMLQQVAAPIARPQLPESTEVV